MSSWASLEVDFWIEWVQILHFLLLLSSSESSWRSLLCLMKYDQMVSVHLGAYLILHQLLQMRLTFWHKHSHSSEPLHKSLCEIEKTSSTMFCLPTLKSMAFAGVRWGRFSWCELCEVTLWSIMVHWWSPHCLCWASCPIPEYFAEFEGFNSPEMSKHRKYTASNMSLPPLRHCLLSCLDCCKLLR